MPRRKMAPPRGRVLIYVNAERKLAPMYKTISCRHTPRRGRIGRRGAEGDGVVGDAGERSEFQVRGHRQRAALKDQRNSGVVGIFLRDA